MQHVCKDDPGRGEEERRTLNTDAAAGRVGSTRPMYSAIVGAPT